MYSTNSMSWNITSTDVDGGLAGGHWSNWRSSPRRLPHRGCSIGKLFDGK